MWVFTETGFVSAVADGRNEAALVLRARDRQSLEPLALLEGCDIEFGAGTDYPYRLTCDRVTFGTWLVAQTTSIDYRNFKDRVHHSRGDHYADALMGVWSAMVDVTDDEARANRW
jgi:hypothetical protein